MLARLKSHLPQNRKKIIPIVLVVLVALIGGYQGIRWLVNGGNTTFSGTIETTKIYLGTETGGRVEAVNVGEGAVIQANQLLVEVRRANGGLERVRAPLNGTVLERLVEPGEVISPGGPLLILADLNRLTLTVYVPEDRYGRIKLGQVCAVYVDSFPNYAFHGTVRYIADQAEFTPRNVQTSDSRKSTVFAVQLELDPAGGNLKPGMPADVVFDLGR